MGIVDELNESIRKKRRILDIMGSELPDIGRKLRLTIKRLDDEFERRKAEKVGLRSGNDLISELPDDIISSIVSCLTLRDAVKTSLLSHRWTTICASSFCLKFDWDNILLDRENKWWLQSTYPCTKYYKDKFVRAVNKFLQFYYDLHQGVTRIGSFQLYFCLGKDYTKDIDQLISLATKMGAQSITLCLDCSKHCLHSYEKIYVFRRELLSQGTEFNLKHLELQACILGPNLLTKFINLVTLKLVDIPLCLSDVQTICSSCLSLSHLFFIECNLPLKLSIVGSVLCLRILIICDCSGVEQIELSAMNLLRFEYSSIFWVKHFFLRAPKLEEAYFTVEYSKGEVYDRIFHQLAEDLPNLRILYVLACGHLVRIPKSIVIFSKVETLQLCFIRKMDFDALKMIAILRAFPLLRKFSLAIQLPKKRINDIHVEVHMTKCPKDFEQGGKLEHNKHVHKYLEEVHLAGFYGTSSQIEFAIYLLKHALSLKLLVIDPKVKYGEKFAERWYERERLSWYEGEQEKVYEKLQEFSKDDVLIIK